MSNAEQHLSILSKYLNLEDGTILDIGSGGGEVTLALSKRGANVTGIECSSDQMCRALKLRRSGCRFLLGVGENLPFKESCFDASVFFNSIHDNNRRSGVNPGFIFWSGFYFSFADFSQFCTCLIRVKVVGFIGYSY